MNDAFVVRGFESFGDLAGDAQCFFERERSFERLARHQFHHQRAAGVGFFDAVDLRDVRMIQGRQNFRFALEAGETLRGSRASAAGRTLIATSRSSLVSRALYTSPMPPAPMGARIS